MKFKSIFFLFNAIIIISLGFILFMPVFLLDWEYTRIFWSTNWYIALLFSVFFIGLNVYFLRFWKVYELLEREDWHALQAHLTHAIFTQGRCGKQHVRLFIHNAIVLSRPEEIISLRDHLQRHCPRRFSQFGLLLGIPFILQNDHQGMEQHYFSVSAQPNRRSGQWLIWARGFSLFLQKRLDDAGTHIEEVLDNTKDPVLRLMSLYMYESCASGNSGSMQRYQEWLQDFRRQYSSGKILAAVERKQDNILVLILDQFIHDAVDWMYQDTEPEDIAGDR